MSKVVWAGGVAGGLASAYAIHGMVTGTGAAGWIEQMQVALLGTYSLKATALLLTLAVFLVAAMAAIGAAVVGGPEPEKAAAPMPARRAPVDTGPIAWRTGLGWALTLTAITYAIGIAFWWWDTRTDLADARAAYVPLVLQDPAQPVATGATHLAVQGRLLGDRVLEHVQRRGASRKVEHYYVPLVAPGWRVGQPVPFVVQVEVPARLEMLRAGPLLARVEGAVPVVAAQAFAKGGAPMADTARLLRWIPSQDGRAAVPDESGMVFRAMSIVCGIISLAWVALSIVIVRASRTGPKTARA